MVYILLCTYNGERYLGEQLESLVHQTYKDIRIILSDDGSTDGTGEIIRKYTQEYPDKIHTITLLQLHLGACKHFLCLINEVAEFMSEDDEVMLCDQDDVWLPEKVMKTLAEMERMRSLYGKTTPLLVHADAKLVDESLQEIAPSFCDYMRIPQGNYRFHHLIMENSVTGASAMINNPLVELLSTVPEHAVMHDHWMALVAAEFGRISFLDQPLYLYRQHGTNVLGAHKGGIQEEVAKPLAKKFDQAYQKREKQRARENYMALFHQAEDFYTIYYDRLSEEERTSINEFVHLTEYGRFRRVSILLRGKFLYAYWYRNLGELIFFWRWDNKN